MAIMFASGLKKIAEVAGKWFELARSWRDIIAWGWTGGREGSRWRGYGKGTYSYKVRVSEAMEQGMWRITRS